MDDMRREIPDSLRAILMDEAGYQCPYCGHRDGLNLTTHHMKAVEEGGPTEYGNLIVLCHNCHARVHDSKSISAKDIRRIKRHLVQRFFTQVGVNATRIAYAHPLRIVAIAPVQIQHLVDMEFFVCDEEYENMGWTDQSSGKDHPSITTLAGYVLTHTGIVIAKDWIIRSDDAKLDSSSSADLGPMPPNNSLEPTRTAGENGD